MDDLKFLDPYSHVRITGSRLPHWQQKNASYFITFRSADSVPEVLLDQWDEERRVWLKFHPQPWTPEVETEFYRRFPGRVEEWLDAGHGACVLQRPECAQVVINAFRHFDGDRYDLHSAVIMPNHVHLLVAPLGEWSLEKLVHSWKLFTARKINAQRGEHGTLWMPDYFDRMIRDEQHFIRVVRYIRNNPAKANLRPDQYAFYESDVAKRLE